MAQDVVKFNLWENLNCSVRLYRFKVCLCRFWSLQESSLMHLLNSSESSTPFVSLFHSLHSADQMHSVMLSAWFSLGLTLDSKIEFDFPQNNAHWNQWKSHVTMLSSCEWNTSESLSSIATVTMRDGTVWSLNCFTRFKLTWNWLSTHSWTVSLWHHPLICQYFFWKQRRHHLANFKVGFQIWMYVWYRR